MLSMNLIDGGEAVRATSKSNIVEVLGRRKWLMLITFVVVFGGATVGTFLMPKQYETHLKILVKNERADIVVTPNSNSAAGYRSEVSETQINTEIELLNSENLLQQVVIRCGLDRPEHSSGAPESERTSVAIEKAVSRLQRDLKISPVRKADIIEVDYSSENPRQAAAVLRQLAESYLEVHLKVHATPGTYEFFTAQATRYHRELEDDELKLAQFRQQNNIVVLDQQKEELLKKAADAESTLMQAEANIREYKYKGADTRRQLDAAAARVVTQSRTVPNQYSVEHLGSMLAELRNRRTQLLAKFRPEDRLVQETEQEINDTQAAFERARNLTGVEQSTDVNPVHQALEIEMTKERAELAGVEARRPTLVQQAQYYHQQLIKLGNVTAAYDDLTRNQKEAEENYLLYTKKTEEARIAELLDQQKIANVAIAGVPMEPHVPSKPNVPLNLALGALLAGFFSFGLALGWEYFQQPAHLVVDNQPSVETDLGGQQLLGALKTAADLEELTGLSILATTRRP